MTLRVRLMLGLATLLAVCLTVAGTISVLALRSHLVDDTDGQLRGAQNLMETRGIAVVASIAPLLGGEGLARAVAPTDFLVEIREPGGQVLSLAGDGQRRAAGDLLAAVDDLSARTKSGRPFPVVAGGTRYRAVAGTLPGGAVDLVALPMRPTEVTVRRLALTELVAGGAALLLGGAAAWLLLGRGLRPLREITTTAVAIAGGDLARRVPHGPPGTETDRLGAALNIMLAQIQAAFEDRERSRDRLRRFVADASHELRTPLTSVRGYVDLLRGGVVPPAGTDDALRRVQDETRRMTALVDDLLYLAHLDEARPMEHATVDLAAIVRDAVGDAAAIEPDRPWTTRADERCAVLGDADALRQVVGNLVANVRVHTPRGTPAEVSVRTVDGRVVLEVRDDGPGLPPADLDRVFDRFYRSAAGRDRGRGGTGLGMSIVAAVAAAHGGDAAATSAAGDGLTVRVTLPAAQSRPGRTDAYPQGIRG
jgi:two-component system OmpR family sensor kinase